MAAKKKAASKKKRKSSAGGPGSRSKVGGKSAPGGARRTSAIHRRKASGSAARKKAAVRSLRKKRTSRKAVEEEEAATDSGAQQEAPEVVDAAELTATPREGLRYSRGRALDEAKERAAAKREARLKAEAQAVEDAKQQAVARAKAEADLRAEEDRKAAEKIRKAAGPMNAMGKGNPPPFVVARGEDHLKVLDEVLKHTGFFDLLEELLEESGKRRETFEVAAYVDFMAGMRKEDPPVSYVDPRLVRHIFDQLLDRGFRLLRVVACRNELSRYLRQRSVKEVGNALGYDESCYELRDLVDDLVPVDFVGKVGVLAAGRLWEQADCRISIAKNSTDEIFGPSLILANIWRSLPVPTEIVAWERGLDPAEYVVASLKETPVHFGLIEAFYSRDGSPGGGAALEMLRDEEGNVPDKPNVLQTNAVLAGRDILAVEAAGQRMQGVDPLEDRWFFRHIRKSMGYRPPEEVNDLPLHPGWRSLGAQIRNVLDLDRPVEVARYGLLQSVSQKDGRIFPSQPGGYQQVRLRQQVKKYLKEVATHRSSDSATADVNGSR